MRRRTRAGIKESVPMHAKGDSPQKAVCAATVPRPLLPRSHPPRVASRPPPPLLGRTVPGACRQTEMPAPSRPHAGTRRRPQGRVKRKDLTQGAWQSAPTLHGPRRSPAPQEPASSGPAAAGPLVTRRCQGTCRSRRHQGSCRTSGQLARQMLFAFGAPVGHLKHAAHTRACEAFEKCWMAATGASSNTTSPSARRRAASTPLPLPPPTSSVTLTVPFAKRPTICGSRRGNRAE